MGWLIVQRIGYISVKPKIRRKLIKTSYFTVRVGGTPTTMLEHLEHTDYRGTEGKLKLK